MADPTALRSGENRPWPDARVTAYVAGARVSALLLGTDGRALDAAAWVDATAPSRSGVEHLGGAVEGVTVHLPDVDAAVARVVVVATGFGPAPTAQLLTTDGAVAFTVTPERLSVETALVMAEVYRREGAWKVRALAQGYAGGPAALAAAHGAPAPASAPAPPAPPPPPVPPGQSAEPAQPAPMVVDDPVRRIGMILDDASRTTASFESSEAFAEQRLERDLEQVVGDPSMRIGPRGDAARAEAQRRRDQLVAEARARHHADLAQLTGELADLARVLPAALAPWSAPAWGDDDPANRPEPAWAFRLGELALESAPDFRLPMLRVLPLAPPVWIELEDGGEVVAGRMMAALTTRILVALPRAPRVAVVDVGARAGLGHLPTDQPPATDPTSAARLLQEHVEHVNLVLLARRSRGLDDLAPEHRPGRLLLLPDFPSGLDDASVAAVHQLVLNGAQAGLNVVLSGRRPQSLGIPVLDLLHDSCLRVPTAPGGDLVDAFGGVTWVFHPDLGPDDPFVDDRVQATVRRRIAERDVR
ncbi:TerD family protein [Nocardioides dongxiaopingii]|uniref:TerD family protein n=1 Tax=Nocardioides sp. S-1144 TaxID=2582905 RepID=UPI00110F236A|nr:TerD family protein [Nocardioides sp. S-1144]QCW51892.1 TerD family protein [Nocardioides sp. S-1144]